MPVKAMKKEDLQELVPWLTQLNQQDAHFIAWLEASEQDIWDQLTPLLTFNENLCWIYREQGEICGFLGILPFFEQGVSRLLGPFTTSAHANVVFNQLWNYALPQLEEYFTATKVAFFKRNQKLQHFCEEHAFQCYNIEKSLTLANHAFTSSVDVHHQTSIVSYQPSYQKQVSSLHPAGAFYTIDEMLYYLQQEGNHLWCYVTADNNVLGYLYFETIPGVQEGEICFVHVDANHRNRGIGTQLIQYACNIAFRHHGLDLVTLSVRENNEEAERLYKQLGFQEAVTIYAYQKRLDPS